MNSAAVYRLRKTWEGVPRKRMEAYNALDALMNRKKNYKAIRDVLRTENSPCIPYLGMYLTDLTFLEEGMPDTVDGMVNFVKRRRVSAVIREIQQFQQGPYMLEVVPEIREFLTVLDLINDEAELHRISQQLEPREPKKQ
ncbi:putative ras-specific guanine nucleotide-releasing factor 2 [Paratrimastix pyriformis]|uniref:Ras-specific guanine nucleotide-releasing factor 2 n=1 Tax=Paratrimastix pyriformis TaxID=342808 RepID=A0ABQ8U6C7_9EUKA|nr:putative ras-specific guanine nucleotide-releasing factor 2 [Paratrimastix pyriformis]